jgi:AraC-like DNA-binding protein
LDDLGRGGRFSGHVRRLIAEDDDNFRSLEQLAAHLDLSPRTLRRRLAADGVSFSALVDEGRRDKALRLLRSSRLPIERIARQLGYTSASTFVRAFHRWTGKTPVQYRRAVGAP